MKRFPWSGARAGAVGALGLALVLSLGACLSAPAAPQDRTWVGRVGGPTLVLISGPDGAVRLRHDGALVREQSGAGGYSAAVVLGGPLDRLEWTGAPARVLGASSDPAAVGRRALAETTSTWAFVVRTDGALELVRGPAAASDADSGASAEE